MPNIKYFKPNTDMDKEFSNALLLANEKGVNLLAYNSKVKPDEINLGEKKLKCCCSLYYKSFY